ncbi:MAG: methylmalonyl-CoA epimerase [Firmicutes bacterium]|nr:methylmalonyl-CoA epimerase [Bacillota bacterium]
MKIEKIDHICIAVKDLEKAEKYFKKIFGLTPDDRYIEESEKINVIRYYIGEVGLELMGPTDADSNVAKFIEKYGEGFYLLSLKVNDAEKALTELKAKNIPLIDETPRQWRDSNYIFIKPKAFFGVLMELID